jgi:hypothetical protein
MTSRRPSRLIGISIAAAGLAAGIFAAVRPRATAAPPAPAPAIQSSEALLARVGPRIVTTRDLARYQKIRKLSSAEVSDRQALDELADRTLLALCAEEAGVTASEAEVAQRAMQLQLVIAAGRPSGRFAPNLMERANRMLARDELSLRELRQEAAAEALAAAARQALVHGRGQALQDLLAKARARWPVVAQKSAPLALVAR